MKKLLLLLTLVFIAYGVTAQDNRSKTNVTTERTVEDKKENDQKTIYIAIKSQSMYGKPAARYEPILGMHFKRTLSKEDAAFFERLPEMGEKFTHSVDLLNFMASNGWKFAHSENFMEKEVITSTYYFKKDISRE